MSEQDALNAAIAAEQQALADLRAHRDGVELDFETTKRAIVAAEGNIAAMQARADALASGESAA